MRRSRSGLPRVRRPKPSEEHRRRWLAADQATGRWLGCGRFVGSEASAESSRCPPLSLDNRPATRTTIHRVDPEKCLDQVIATIRERIDAYRLTGIGEQNTKAGLIAPLLRALGWDTEDLREVHLEFKPRSADKPVDYALLLNGQPRMFVEAKALGKNLQDRRWASQIMGYAAVAGVRWVVLTNGDEYRLYNAHASVPVDEKLFRTVRVSDPESHPEETLALLSKESVAELEALWQEDFIDRQVRTALDALFEPEPDDGLLRLLRRRLPPELTPNQVRSSLSRLRATNLGESVAQAGSPALRRAEAKPTIEPSAAKRFGEGTPWSAVTLGDIISTGRLRPPVDLFRRYKGQELRARIEDDGRVSFAGQVYASLSVAGQMARRSVIGADQRAQTNGWTFWKHRAADGGLHEIDELRRELWESRSGSP